MGKYMKDLRKLHIFPLRFMESLNMTTIGDVCTNVLRQFLNDPLVPKPKHCVL